MAEQETQAGEHREHAAASSAGGAEIRLANGELDEFIAQGANIHLERMDKDAWWMGITLPSGERWDLRLGECRHLGLEQDKVGGQYYKVVARKPRKRKAAQAGGAA